MANSGKTENKYRTIAATTTPFIIIGGLCIGFGWRYASGAWKKKPKQNLPRSISFAAIHGGKLALERLVDYHNYHGKSTELDGDLKELESLLANEQPNFKELQRVLGRLEMSRREDEAIKLLKNALKKAKKDGKTHEVYEIEMLLAEMYIYQGDFQKALKCKCLVEDERFSEDARAPLFKAIISLMDQKEQDAMGYWKKFKETQYQTIPPDFNEQEFTELKNAVNLLQEDINAAKQPVKQ